MKVQVGDWLVVEGTTAEDHRRMGQIVEVRSDDGAPPYLVHWLEDDHVTLVFPGTNARVEPRPVHATRLRY